MKKRWGGGGIGLVKDSSGGERISESITMKSEEVKGIKKKMALTVRETAIVVSV